MKSMRTPAGALAIALLLATGTALAAPRAEAPPVTSPVRDTAVLDKVIADAIGAHQMVGAVVGIAHGADTPVFLSYGKADLDNDVPMTPEAVFRIGSLTKQFTAAAILLLAERGQLSLDDRLDKFFPEFPMADQVTVRQLLQHTSGISNFTARPEYDAFSKQDRSPAEMVAYFETMKPLYDFAPGERWRYSNSGYVILGAIVEQVSGQSFGAFLQANIFKPLGLDDTSSDVAAAIVPHRTRGYSLAEKGRGFTNADYMSFSIAVGGGDIRSTAPDLLGWNHALLGGKLLKPESLALMLQPARLNNGKLTSSSGPVGPLGPAEYGFGLMFITINGRRAVGHAGSINGYRSALWNLPDDKLTVVVLANADLPPDLMPKFVAAAAAAGGALAK